MFIVGLCVKLVLYADMPGLLTFALYFNAMLVFLCIMMCTFYTFEVQIEQVKTFSILYVYFNAFRIAASAGHSD